VVSKELNDWLLVVGLFGVLGGLLFVDWKYATR